ncbi:MAG TPA: hypothetical protein VII01_05475 [Solirubrobacteraceae bacterium]|jgi:hypothetical protein
MVSERQGAHDTSFVRLISQPIVDNAALPTLTSLLGLQSLEPVYDDEAAAIAEQAVGGYRRRASTPAARQVLLCTQKCLRICAGLSPLSVPSAVTPLLPGARWAAGALAAVVAMGAADVVHETSTTLSVLNAA